MSYISLSMIISSSALIVVLALLRRLLRAKVSSRVQYALWLLVALRLLLPFDIGSLDFSLSSVADTPAAEQRLQEVIVPVRPYEPVTAEEYSAQTGTPISSVSQSELETYAQQRQSAPLSDILFWVWLAGAIILALWQTIVNIRFALRLKRTAAPLDVEAGASPLPLYRADWLASPCLFGIFKPVIYVNQALDADRLRHIVTHEYCHYRHGDHIWALLRALCLSLHWFNPLVWWAVALSRRDSELACDEAALKLLGDDKRRAYGETLLSLAPREPQPLFDGKGAK